MGDVIGNRLAKIDSWDKVIGAAKYADDMRLPRMLHARILRSTIPHARIVGIDTHDAEQLPGVVAVITGRDVPIEYGILPSSQDEQALCVDKVRFVGDPVAAVAALDVETAERALALIHVEYEPLTPVMSIPEALDTSRDAIHTAEHSDDHNVHKMVALEFGDLDAGFADADYILEENYFYQGNTHLALEEHAALASFSPDGHLTLWSSTQTPHYVHRALAKTLELPASRIRVVAATIGGGFGGKTDPFSHEIVACKLAMLTGRPVKINLTREEVFYCHRGRHPVLMWVKMGVRNDGAPTALHFRTILDGGAYGSYGVASTYYTGALQTVTYKIPAYKFEGMRVYTNKPPCGPKRGHGTPQPRFALEIHLDKIARHLGLDPAAYRKRFIVDDNTKTVNHLTITTCGLRECIDKVVDASGFGNQAQESKIENQKSKIPNHQSKIQTGFGLACGSYLSGAGLPIYWNQMPHSGVIVKVDRGGGVAVFCGSTDIGQGSTSLLAYIAAQEFGIDVRDVRVITADTDLTPVDLGSYSSRVTVMTGNACIQAVRPLKEKILDAAAEKLLVPAESLSFKNGEIVCEDDDARRLKWTDAVVLAEAKFGTLSGTGSYKPPKRAGPYKGSGVGITPSYSYAACVAQVSVDTETGQVRVEKIWLAHDGGRALNPILVEGQVEGSVYMGVGEALMEEMTYRGGLHKGPSLLDYKSLTMRDMPPVETFLVETNDPEGPFGAKEAGQGPLLPVPPAIANAIYDAIGVRIDETPITPDKILKALEEKDKGRAPRVGPKNFPNVQYPEPIRVDPPENAPRLEKKKK